jgi:hypothetical protein
MTLNKVPWERKMRRLQPGDTAEWMAPDEVVEQVRNDYLRAQDWLGESQLWARGQQLHMAAYYLSGEALKNHQVALLNQGRARFIGVLRADHEVEVRHFSETGDRCLLVDFQSGRRMATYNAQTRERLMTQDMGSGAVVYQLAYDLHDRRWKLERLIQELPAGWERRQPSGRIQEFTQLPLSIGRDN